MTIEEKYREWREFYLNHFVMEGEPEKEGSYLPLEYVRLSINENFGFSGDGTINLAQYIAWAWLNNDKTRLNKAVTTLKRLIECSYNIYKTNYPKCALKQERGFFVRDDINYNVSKYLGLDKISSGYKGSILGFDEDVCYSPFTSQDQCWNLLPALLALGNNEIGKDIFGYVVKHHHVIYNPYISQVLHNHIYCDLKVPYGKRIEDREEHLKYKVKVKRGANNWYFAYGFKKAYEKFGGKCSKWNKFVSALWYKPFILLADRVYHEYMCKWLKIRVKQTSYYSLGVCADAWYCGDVHKRILNKMNKALEVGDVFLPEIFVYSKYANKVNKGLLERWLDNYPTPKKEGLISSPIDFLIMYSFYKGL